MKHTQHQRRSAAYARLDVAPVTADNTENLLSFESTSLPVKKKMRIFAPLVVVFALLAFIYLAGVFFFSHAFYPSTTLDGEEVSMKFVKELALAKKETGERAYLRLLTPDSQTLEIQGSDVGLRIDGNAYAHTAMMTQQPWLWPMRIWGIHNLDVSLSATFDTEKLTQRVDTLVEEHNEHAQEARNATAKFSGASNSFTIEPEQEGTMLNAEYVESKAADALISLDSELKLSKDAFVSPTIKQDDEALKKAVDTANSMLKASQLLTIEGTEVAKVEPKQIASWISISDKNDVKLDSEAIKQWTQGDLSKELDTVGSRRSYTLPGGGSVTVSGGSYGWSIDGAALAKTLADNIAAAKSETIEVPMEKTAVNYNHGKADWGDRWIDVNLTTQHAVLYDKGKNLWESDLVSGDVSIHHETPTGVYAINSYMDSKETSGKRVKLISPFKDKNGKPTYTSYVDWWIPFLDNQYAFHDSPWREEDEYGGTTYKHNGSHGCLNLTPDHAKSLYKLVDVGDVVVVHD